MTFAPTHSVPATGLSAWASPDPTAAPVARLDPWLDVQVLRTWGSWAEVLCSNGWSAWTDAARLEARPTAPPAPIPPPPPPPPASVSAAPIPPPPSGPQPYQPGAPAYQVTSYAEAYRAAYPQGRTPAQVAASGASAGGPAILSVGPVLLGALAVAVGAFLPWVSSGFDTWIGSPDIPLLALVSMTAEPGPVSVAVLLVAAAVVAVVASARPGLTAVRRGAGWVAVIVATLYVAQVQRALSQAASLSPESAQSLFSFLGFGVYVVLVGGLVVALAPERRTT